MNIIETPWDFSIEKKIGKNVIKYVNLEEICQGGPEIGEIYINNNKINGFKFGGPLLYNNNKVAIPLFVNGFFNKGFKIVIIDLNNKYLLEFGNLKDLVILNSFEENEITFYSSIDRNDLKIIDLRIEKKKTRLISF
jgi:hypothetical protein